MASRCGSYCIADLKTTAKSPRAGREVTPQHNLLVDAILASTCHVIVTMRTKTGYEVTSENGKTKVNKVGLAPIQREGLEYEFTVVMDLSMEGHVATASKDRTGLFDANRLTPDSHTGSKLLAWLESREIPTDLGESPGMRTLMEILGQIGIDDLHDEYAVYVCERYGISKMDEMNASQTSEQITMLMQCLAREEKMSQFVDILRQRKLAA